MSSTRDTAAPSDAASPAYPVVRFRELFEQAPVSLQILDPEGYTVQVNRAWEALWHIYEGSELKRHVLSREYNVLRDPQLVEGGITEAELATLTAAGGRPVRMGPDVLRSSSAGIVALSAIGALSARWPAPFRWYVE